MYIEPPKVFVKLGMTELGLFVLIINLLNQAGCMPQVQYITPPITADFEKSKQAWASIIEGALKTFRELCPNLLGVQSERAAAMFTLAQVINSLDLGAVEFVDFTQPITEHTFRPRINALVELLFTGPKQVTRTERSTE